MQQQPVLMVHRLINLQGRDAGRWQGWQVEPTAFIAGHAV